MKRIAKTGTRAALAAVAALLAGPAAAALPNLVKSTSASVGVDSESPKTAVAFCPPGQFVVGGGAWADDFGASQVALTRLQPIHGGPQDRYVATAEEPAAGFSGDWWLEAYALCAGAQVALPAGPSALAGYEIVSHTTSPASPPFVATAARCPSGKLVSGTGSRILNSGGQVGLQLSRASVPLDISRATARERASGYDRDWSLTSYAICARPAGLKAGGTVLAPGPAIPFGAFVSCPPSARVHAVGGGGSLFDTGESFLQILYPSNDLGGVQVFMTASPPNGMVIQAICG